MSKQKYKETKLTVRVSEQQYEKIKDLAEIRDLNVTEYMRLVSCGNRIKPTVIEKIGTQNDSNEIVEQLKKDNEALKSDAEALREKANILDRFLPHINENAYINFNSFKDDDQLREALKELKQNEGGITFQ